MFLKKVSIFIDTYLRKRLSEDDCKLLAPAFSFAIAFPVTLVRLMLSTGGWPCGINIPPELTKLHKCFVRGYAESGWVRDAYKTACRVEATLSIIGKNVINTDIAFFAKSAKDPHFNFRASFDSDGNVVTWSIGRDAPKAGLR